MALECCNFIADICQVQGNFIADICQVQGNFIADICQVQDFQSLLTSLNLIKILVRMKEKILFLRGTLLPCHIWMFLCILVLTVF